MSEGYSRLMELHEVGTRSTLTVCWIVVDPGPLPLALRFIIENRLTGGSGRGYDQVKTRTFSLDPSPSGPTMIQEFEFAPDSPLEGTGFEPSVPLKVLTVPAFIKTVL